MKAASVEDLELALAEVRRELESVDQEIRPMLAARAGRNGRLPQKLRALVDRRRELMASRDSLEAKIARGRFARSRVEPVIVSGRVVAVHVEDGRGNRTTWIQGELELEARGGRDGR